MYGTGCSTPYPMEASLSGQFDGLGAATAARAQAIAARKVSAANKKSARLAKKAVKVGNKTVLTSDPTGTTKIHAMITAAGNATSNVIALHAAAKKSKKKADYQKAFAAGSSALNTVKTLMSVPATTPPSVAKTKKLRGMGYMGVCVDDGMGNPVDDGTQPMCDPSTWGGSGGQYAYNPSNPYGQQQTYTTPYQSGSVYQNPISVQPIGLTPIISPSLTPSNYAPLRACSNGSNLPRCIIYQMAVDEQSQFQYVFSILQQMYAQLLTIVQQLMQELGSAQQQPYYGQQSYNPYGQQPYSQPYSPYGPYGDPSAGYGYGGQYAGPGGYPGAPYYGGGGDTSSIPSGYDTGGDIGAGVPGDVTQLFPGPGSGGASIYPTFPTDSGGGLVSSDSLPSGADQQSGDGMDDAAGIVPQAQAGPNLSPTTSAAAASQGVSSSVNAPIGVRPQVILLQQGPGQSPYSDAGLPAGDRQNQPELDPPEHDEFTGSY